jgi:hypothetical protein
VSNYGLQVARVSDAVLQTAPSIKGAVFVAFIDLAGNISQTFTYPLVPAGSLYVYQIGAGAHAWVVGSNGSSQATLTLTTKSYTQNYNTQLLVFASATTEANYGVLLKNDAFENALSAEYAVPIYLGKVTLGTTPDASNGGFLNGWTGGATSDGYYCTRHSATTSLGAGKRRIVLWTLPDVTADTWFAGTSYLYEAGNTVQGYFFAGSGVSTYTIPEALIFSLEDHVASSATYGLRIWNAAGKLTYDSGLSHTILRDLQSVLAYPVDVASANNTYSLSSLASPISALFIPAYTLLTTSQLAFIPTGSKTLNRDAYTYGVIRKNGATLESKLLRAPDIDYVLPSGFLTNYGSFEYGVRTGLFQAIVSTALFGGAPSFASTTPPPFTLSSLTNAYATSTGSQATLTLINNGNVTGADISKWGTPQTTGIGSSYWVRATRTAGSAVGYTGIALGTWTSLASDQILRYTAAALSYRAGTFTLEFSTSASGSPIVMTCTNVTVELDRT